MKRILVVDDEPDLVETLATILTMEGYEVFHAADGHQAIERVRHLHPDLVILDFMLPGLGGGEVGLALRAGADTREVRILMSSSFDEPSVRQIFRGYDAYARKPLDVEKTLPLIASLVDG